MDLTKCPSYHHHHTNTKNPNLLPGLICNFTQVKTGEDITTGPLKSFGGSRHKDMSTSHNIGEM